MGRDDLDQLVNDRAAITGTAWNGPRFFELRAVGEKPVDESPASSVPRRMPPKGRASIRPRQESRPTGKLAHGQTFQEAQIDRA
jgi:hypothetical protein